MKVATVRSIRPTYAKTLSGMIGKHQRGLFYDCKEHPRGVLLLCENATYPALFKFLDSKGFRYRSTHDVDGTVRVVVYERVV